MVRGAGHADEGQPVRRVAEQRLGLAVAEAELLADDQAAEQLREREVVAAPGAAVQVRPDAPRELVRVAEHLPWRAGRFHPAASSVGRPVALPYGRRTRRA